jgi:serine/threonine-protein kinase
VSTSAPTIGQTLGHYRILQQLGAGGMGVVFRAHDLRLERDVAVKVLTPSVLSDAIRRKRFRQEALTLSRLNHQNIAQVYDFDTWDGIDFLVMEYVEGKTLSATIRDGPLPEGRAVALGRQIVSTLEHAHREGIVHCDIKPGNIIITPNDQVKLLDFGLAELLRIGDGETTKSLAGFAVAGTLPYMAPEQLLGRTCDFRVDIYAVGVLLYELITARQPFCNPISAALIDEILHKTPDPPEKWRPGLSSNIQSVIAQCLEKDPKRRYQTTGELGAALAAIQSGGTRPPGINLSKVPRLKVRPILIAFAMLLVVAVFGFLLRRYMAEHLPKHPIVRGLAVLPVATVQPDAQAAAFGNGLIETLTARLARLSANHSLQVIPASEIRNKGVSTLQEARQEFGASLGLELSVERAGDMVRVTYALVDANLHQQVNGDSITAAASDPFALEDRVSESVVNALDLELEPQERKDLTTHGTEQPKAYDYYLQGRGYLQDFHKLENVESAIAEFNLAVQIDPKYALAYAGLGEAFWRKYQLMKQPEWASHAEVACEHAIALRSDEASGHSCLGLVYNGTGKYENAVEQYKQATELEPTDDRGYSGLAIAYERLGKPKEAEETFRHAISVRPNDWATYNWLGELYLKLGRFPEAAEMFQQVVSLTPDSFAGYGNEGSAYIYMGQYAKAVPLLQRSVAIRETAENISNLATAYFQLRQYAEAARVYEKAVALSDQNYEIWGNLGDAYYWAPGERSKAKNAYQKAIELGDEHLRVNPRDQSLLSYLAQDYAMSGQSAQALAYINRALQIAPKDPDLLLTAAIVFNQIGEVDKALNYLEEAAKAGASPTTLRATPNFDNLQSLPRFQRLIGPL